MHSSTIDQFSRTTASSFISLYQKHLSPYKGFSCAYRVLHHSESCSQYAKRMILEQGFSRAIPLVRQRFRDCRAANETLQARRQRCQKRYQVQRLPSSTRPLPAPQSLSSANDPMLGNSTNSGFQAQPLSYRDRSLETQGENLSWRAIESSDQEPESPADGQENGESGQSDQRRRVLGGSFRKRGATSDKGDGGYSDWSDCGDCGDWGDCAIAGCDAPDCSGVDCSSAHCNSLDCGSMDCSHCNSLDCGSMDCSGADCSGADCSGADCSGCDVGSCG